MLELINIKKDYPVAGGIVTALKGVSVKFRDNEFVSVLGASGCGKTTLLNIIGGLDKYTSGDLIIDGKSTKKYDDGDWDTYRNHSIGFIFQSYHLIPHQTILQNVELALTISGVSKEERRKRAIEALGKVGLADKINNRPNQLSGGQAQRVAIARALINDPEIVLADEPTGALDSKTSVQIMELLKEISKDRLVIMVTHNPELAEKYSTRIIRILDGEITDDTMPYDGSEEEKAEVNPDVSQGEGVPVAKSVEKKNKGRKKKSSMSFPMAFSLSLKNLLSKRKRTAMVSVAGSIGIIGVSMVLAISAGVHGYIDDMENDMLSGYPLTVTKTAIDFTSLMNASISKEIDIGKLDDKVYVDNMLETLMKMGTSLSTNNITAAYKHYVDGLDESYYNAVQYGYGFDMSQYIYTDFTSLPEENGVAETRSTSVKGIRDIYSSVLSKQVTYGSYASMISSITSFMEIPANSEYVLSQYDVLAMRGGEVENLTDERIEEIFNSESTLVLVLEDNEFSDLNYGQYGYMTESEFLQFAYKAEGSHSYDETVIADFDGKVVDGKITEGGKTFDYFVGENAKSFKWYPNDEVFVKPSAEEKFELQGQPIPGSIVPFKYCPYSTDFNKDSGLDLQVKLILQKKDSISYGCLAGGLYYTRALAQKTLKSALESKIVKYINSESNSTTNRDGDKALWYLPYSYDFTYYNPDDDSKVKKETKKTMFVNTEVSLSDMMGGTADVGEMMKVAARVVAGAELPIAISIYPVDFKTKEEICTYLDKWNDKCLAGETYEWSETTDGGTETHSLKLTEADKINYTDTVGIMMTMIGTMVDMVTIALVAFTALSLVVSTVMVGIITYVSVVERIKEIGILRAVGARKKDIKRLFLAETFMIGLCAGVVGIAVTYLLSLIINIIVSSLAGVAIAALPIWQALIMICVSVILTLISGVAPAAAAAKKDPVVALRTE